ncbi:hypothetical protein ACYSNW_01930 [Enterococcus sp. LJL99]
MSETYTANSSVLFGLVIFFIGLLIFCFGKKFFLLRLFFGDRSMFSQIFVGGVLGAIGLFMMYLGGAF